MTTHRKTILLTLLALLAILCLTACHVNNDPWPASQTATQAPSGESGGDTGSTTITESIQNNEAQPGVLPEAPQDTDPNAPGHNG